MLLRMRITLPDRPGALATLATELGAAGVNILGMQVFPGVEAVTDEVVVRVPPGLAEEELIALVDRSGASFVSANPCGEPALMDQPTRYVHAARTVLAEPERFPEVLAQLFDAEPEGAAGDVMEAVVGDVLVQVHRLAPFTATEHARGAALAELVTDVLARRTAEPVVRRTGSVGGDLELRVSGSQVLALAEGSVVGQATLAGECREGERGLVLEVDVAWQRRGIGSRLLVEAARLARSLGDDMLVLRTHASNPAVLPMVLGQGLRGRIRLSDDELVVRIPLIDLTPAGA